MTDSRGSRLTKWDIEQLTFLVIVWLRQSAQTKSSDCAPSQHLYACTTPYLLLSLQSIHLLADASWLFPLFRLHIRHFCDNAQ